MLRACVTHDDVQDNGDGEGPYNATASWGTVGAADAFTTFMDSKTYTSKVSAEDVEVSRVELKSVAIGCAHDGFNGCLLGRICCRSGTSWGNQPLKTCEIGSIQKPRYPNRFRINLSS